MHRGSAGYERELKDLLQGNPEALRRYARRLPPTERARIEGHARRPFLVVRAAGSFGFDLVALRPEFSFPIEVKSSSAETIRFSAAGGRATEQLHQHRDAAGRVELLVIYAFRRLGLLKGDSWRLYATGPPATEGRMGLLARHLPPVTETKEGHGILRWEQGRTLSEFLSDVGWLTAPREGNPA